MAQPDNTKLKRLIGKLRELFQLDQPELDFGIYRIMHAKAGEVTEFLEKDLLPQVREAFAQFQNDGSAKSRKKLEQLVAELLDAGVDPEASPKVRNLRAELAGAVDIAALENEVYDHLYTFFRRYYSEGDFLSKRVYKEGVYALPYEGEEVKLYWANQDQHYIKTSEYLRDYAFRLRPDDSIDPMRVHFRLVDAAEGEHGNVKAAEGKERQFILAAGNFIAEEAGELSLRFEYRPASVEDWPAAQRTGKDKPPSREALIAIAEQRVIAANDQSLQRWLTELQRPHTNAGGEQAEYSRLVAHLRRYSARHTFDYFIHKDLGGFLRRELDFYIKNEVMRLDDIESESAPKVEQYLSKIKALRRIAGKIIDFMAQLENFQKKLWLKKKFVVETSYCIRVGCIEQAFYAEIAANEAQRKEWMKLYAIDEVGGDPVEFIKANPTLVIDTRNFDPPFVARLLSSFSDIDRQTDGLLINGENAHALSLLGKTLGEQVQCIYIDPPYNTGKDDFPYKDSYRHSSWASMIAERTSLARPLLTPSGALFVSIDENEQPTLRTILDAQWSVANHLADFVWITEGNFDNQAKIKVAHEYVIAYAKLEKGFAPPPVVDPSVPSSSKIFSDSIRNTIVKNGPKNPVSGLLLPAGFPADVAEADIAAGSTEWPKYDQDVVIRDGKLVAPVVARSGWSSKELCEDFIKSGLEPVRDAKGQSTRFLLSKTGAIESIKTRSQTRSYVTSIIRSTGTIQATSSMLDDMGTAYRGYPKPVGLAKYLVGMAGGDSARVLDFFAGSGTTAHAVVELNREDGQRRKFVLVEASSSFDEVIVPRLKKLIFSPRWKGGRPANSVSPEEVERSPRILKILRLESYDDSLNNLKLQRSEHQKSLLEDAAAGGPGQLREQYLLRYQLDVEARGSASLLDLAQFSDPTGYRLRVSRASDESRLVAVDLIETFHWLIGLSVHHAPEAKCFTAEFAKDGEGRLTIAGGLQQQDDGPWWFRVVTGALFDGRKTLVIWRKRTANVEKDNLILERWFIEQGYSSKESQFELIYVNGGNTLESLKAEGNPWKVRLIEEDFQRLMFDPAGE